jgi:DNA-binding beta-propeller fold protein YncE
MSNISVPKGSGPEGIVIDSTGSFAVVVYQYSGKLAKLDLATDSLVAELGFGSKMESPKTVILSTDNKIAYVAKMGNIAPIAMSTFTALPEISTGQDSPFYIALTSDGSKGFATVPLGEKIVPFTPHDSKTQEPIRTLKLPGGIDIKARR